MDKFIDCKDAGIALARRLGRYAHANTLVLALPRGGVPVAYEVAKALSLPLDVFIVRKLGVPGHEELAMGTIASGGTIVFNDDIILSLHISEALIQQVRSQEQAELERRELVYRQNRHPLALKDKTIILVDDGIATGATMYAALGNVRRQKPAQVIVAVPVAASSACKEFARQADDFICLLKPVNFYAVGMWYDDFRQTTDEEVAELLGQLIKGVQKEPDKF